MTYLFYFMLRPLVMMAFTSILFLILDEGETWGKWSTLKSNNNCITNNSPSLACHSFCASLNGEMFHAHCRKNFHFWGDKENKKSYDKARLIRSLLLYCYKSLKLITCINNTANTLNTSYLSTTNIMQTSCFQIHSKGDTKWRKEGR